MGFGSACFVLGLSLFLFSLFLLGPKSSLLKIAVEGFGFSVLGSLKSAAEGSVFWAGFFDDSAQGFGFMGFGIFEDCGGGFPFGLFSFCASGLGHSLKFRLQEFFLFLAFWLWASLRSLCFPLWGSRFFQFVSPWASFFPFLGPGLKLVSP